MRELTPKRRLLFPNRRNARCVTDRATNFLGDANRHARNANWSGLDDRRSGKFPKKSKIVLVEIDQSFQELTRRDTR